MTRRLMTAVLTAAALVASTSPVVAAPATETYRPQFHFTPERNWMNDPNGLVYHKGEYHLFYQHNPNGNSWGDMSWGHAVSRDLVRWQELPVAISHDDTEMVFSGSAVVDHADTSGFGTPDEPAMVAVYTSAPKAGGKQAQSLAYSTDRGRTWTKYADNPVLDIGSAEFRDPKVQWHAPTQSWLMAVALATERKIRFYSSKDLKSWAPLSDFGPAGAVGGVWECPDLFPLEVDGDPGKTKWVLVVSINPGGIAGGSAAQYFIGDFDGTRFTADDDGSYTPPAGVVVEDFESTYGQWSTTGGAFGDSPATGPLEGQLPVGGIEGTGYATSFHGGDSSTGTLTSPPFTVDKRYLNFKVGGGRHPHDPAAVTGDAPPPAGEVLADFEGDTYGTWTAAGEAFGAAPATGSLPGQLPVSGWQGGGLVNTFLRGDATVGALTSPEFTLSSPYVNFLIGGGNHPSDSEAPTAVRLVVDGEVVRSATGKDSEALNWASWDVRDLAGRKARFEVVDANTGGWGHILVDHVMLADAPAKPRSTETSVNLVVDGKVVRTATGADSETLDWASFDLREHQGEQARISVVDMNTAGWGHVMVDRFALADAPAKSTVERADWVDYGKDYYAPVSWDNAPDGKRHMIGWMNNWQYAGNIPTSPWRSAQSIPRQVGLRTIGGEVKLVQEPVRALDRLHRGAPFSLHGSTVRDGSRSLGRHAEGQALDIEATFSLRDAERFGLKVLSGAGQETVIGYDTTTGELYVDRTRSGRTDFSTEFPAVQRAPLAAVNGKVTLRALVDWSSVEVFGGAGEAVITSQVFPDPTSDGVEVFAEDGNARIDRLTIRDMGTYRR
ncbi:levanase [Saccharothrix ecbatanensis]|uniref:Levanase n=1 Tax=Saccharothrix ecbatanensis TaxID=1105145 RepID=A0A7W9HJ84_9PSEU|nr:GH32 C-terminal domain-containing protein [Saccharothrix ecbatanensis]MBB5803016.1 levanase [Saccharothrix ecbatanensis]